MSIDLNFFNQIDAKLEEESLQKGVRRFIEFNQNFIYTVYIYF